jgi:hypothetical protein
MSTLTPELWAEHLRASSVIRHGMILEDMERGIDAEQIASRSSRHDHMLKDSAALLQLANPGSDGRGPNAPAATASHVGRLR